MKSGEYQVVGLRFAKAKDGSEGAIIYYVTGFESYEENSALSFAGHKVGQEYTKDPGLVKKIHDLKLNDVCKFGYRKGYAGSAMLDDVNVIKPAGK